jgi:dihydroorotase
MSLLIKNGKVFSSGKFILSDVLIEGLKISKLGKDLKSSGQIIDATGKYVVPGLIDAHVHFRDFDESYKEDWLTGSSAAASSGITTVLDMPNNKPPVDSVKRLGEKIKIAEKQSVINFGLYVNVNNKNIDEINKSSVKFVKLYYGHTTGNNTVDDAEEIFKRIKKDILICVHAEDNEIISENKKKFSGNEKNYHSLIRDNKAEYTAVETLIGLAKKYDRRLHICHVSAKESMLMIKKAKQEKVKVTCETCPHYLILNSRLHDSIGNIAKVNPALKSKSDNEELWNFINDGTIDMITSDHAPHTIKEKASEYEISPSGFPGVETTISLMLTAISQGEMKLERFIEMMTESPAKIFGIKNKGKIEVGFDADITILDLDKEGIIIGKDLFTKARWSPFDGFETKGRAIMTIINGNIVFNEGKIDGSKKGKFIY